MQTMYVNNKRPSDDNKLKKIKKLKIKKFDALPAFEYKREGREIFRKSQKKKKTRSNNFALKSDVKIHFSITESTLTLPACKFNQCNKT